MISICESGADILARSRKCLWRCSLMSADPASENSVNSRNVINSKKTQKFCGHKQNRPLSSVRLPALLVLGLAHQVVPYPHRAADAVEEELDAAASAAAVDLCHGAVHAGPPGIVDDAAVADLRQMYRAEDAVASEDHLGISQVFVGELAAAQPADHAGDTVERRQRLVGIEEDVPGEPIVLLLGADALHPFALDDPGRNAADAVSLADLQRDDSAFLRLAKQAVRVHGLASFAPFCRRQGVLRHPGPRTPLWNARAGTDSPGNA